jgi:hypothetical protein
MSKPPSRWASIQQSGFCRQGRLEVGGEIFGFMHLASSALNASTLGGHD